jgi:RNA polymerase-binding transcription factor DksA
MELEKLTTLRKKLVSRRRALVESLHKVAPEQLSGDSIAKIQSAIEAVDRAIQDESRSSSGRAVPRPALSAEPQSL